MSFANIRDKNDYSSLMWSTIQNAYERKDYYGVVCNLLDYGRCLGYLMWSQQKDIEDHFKVLEEIKK